MGLSSAGQQSQVGGSESARGAHVRLQRRFDVELAVHRAPPRLGYELILGMLTRAVTHLARLAQHQLRGPAADLVRIGQRRLPLVHEQTGR